MNTNEVTLESLMIVDDCIQVWAFSQAPECLQKLSTNGGDEDWIALIPPSHLTDSKELPSWIDSSQFGCCDVQKIEVDKWIIAIGSHA